MGNYKCTEQLPQWHCRLQGCKRRRVGRIHRHAARQPFSLFHHGRHVYTWREIYIVSAYWRQGLFVAQKGINATDGIYATKGANTSGSAVFMGSQYASHFHYSTTEDTYIRGGKSTSNIYISDVGNAVIIGSVPSAPAGYKLYVERGILTEKVKVAVKTSTEWADHVFNKNYPLMPLQKVDAFIQANGHLPGIPSAEEMVKKGNDLGQTDAKLLEKIEELTLYMIEIKKENDQLRQMIHIQNKKIESIGTGISKQ
jgi:hypothetical protein